MQQRADATIDWAEFARARQELGQNFVRILDYFKEDGRKAISQLEDAIRSRQSAALVLPAHKLKNEAREFGAEQLARLAEEIEMQAREFIEWRISPEILLKEVVALRPLFLATIEALDAASNPLQNRRG